MEALVIPEAKEAITLCAIALAAMLLFAVAVIESNVRAKL